MSAQPRAEGHGVRAAGDSEPEMVRVLTRLADDFELFDSIVRAQRQQLSGHPGGRGALDDQQIRRRSRRVAAAATEMVVRVRDALDELQRMSDGPGRRLNDMGDYRTVSRRAGDRQTG